MCAAQRAHLRTPDVPVGHSAATGHNAMCHKGNTIWIPFIVVKMVVHCGSTLKSAIGMHVNCGYIPKSAVRSDSYCDTIHTECSSERKFTVLYFQSWNYQWTDFFRIELKIMKTWPQENCALIFQFWTHHYTLQTTDVFIDIFFSTDPKTL